MPAIALILAPSLAHADGGVADSIHSLQSVLDKLYADMLPRCDSLIGVGRAIAGFAATWYIASRVWGHIARAEAIDFYPLFRPFALGLAILLFPYVIATMNAVLQPTVTGTSLLVENSDKAVQALLKQKEQEIKKTKQWEALVGPTGEGDRELWMKYYHKDEIGHEGLFGSIGNDVLFAMDKAGYNFKNSIKKVIATVLQILFEAASLAINTLRTYILLLLAILGPLVFGIATFDGFQHILQVYLARYINIFLWLPICNILGSLLGTIQENMIKIDLSQIQQTGDTFFSTYDLGYIIFLVIGIVCFTCVPSIADMVLFVGGGGALQSKVTSMSMNTTMTAASGVVGAAGGFAGDIYNGTIGQMQGGMAAGSSGSYLPDKGSGSSYAARKLSG
jgi:conjugative transposon TraJ protein